MMDDRERVSPPDREAEIESLTIAIVSTIAEYEGIDVSEVEEPLYDAINPEHLHRLFRDSSGTVTFVYEGYRVAVTDDHEVTVVDGDER